MAVFAGARIRDNNVFGTTTNNPLTNVGTTLNSAALANLSAVSGNHAVLVLDPLRTAGAPEIVIVTAHTAAATSATITRGAYGTAARQHNSGTLWVLATTKDDLIAILTATPADVYAGQLWYRSDLKAFAFSNGTDVSPMQGGGVLGYATRATNQATITTEVDLTGLSVTVTTATGRRIKVTAHVDIFADVADTVAAIRIKEGTTTLSKRNFNVRPINWGLATTSQTILTPTAGAHTYKLTMARDTGTGIMGMQGTADTPAFILVEDIGAA